MGESLATWISLFTGVVILLLTAIGSLLLSRVVYTSKQNIEEHKELSAAIKSVFDHIEEGSEKCAILHQRIERDIGVLQERTAALVSSLLKLEKDLWAKIDRASLFANSAKSELITADSTNRAELIAADSAIKMELLGRIAEERLVINQRLIALEERKK